MGTPEKAGLPTVLRYESAFSYTLMRLIYGGEGSMWLHNPYLLGVPTVGHTGAAASQCVTPRGVRPFWGL